MGALFGISPASQESKFRQLLDPARREIETISSLQEVADALGEIECVKSLAETRRLSLVLAGSASGQPDEVLDTLGVARLLNRTRDWVQHHRFELAEAAVGAPGARPRYSRPAIERLVAKWQRKGKRK